MINDLVFQAYEEPGEHQIYSFSDDLRVEVLVDGKVNVFRISYPDEYPALPEFWLFLRSWPYEVELVTPKMIAHSGRKYLSGSWVIKAV
jgi:hypothetical protein